MISIVDNGLHIEDGVLRYAWFRLDTPHGERWRAVTFRELASVPYDVAKETDTLGRQWAALRGIYNADVDYVYTALGIFHPEHVGIVQLYGAAGEGQNRETAAVMALEGLAGGARGSGGCRCTRTPCGTPLPRIWWTGEWGWSGWLCCWDTAV